MGRHQAHDLYNRLSTFSHNSRVSTPWILLSVYQLSSTLRQIGMATFTLFPLLPTWARQKIWQFAARDDGRIVKLDSEVQAANITHPQQTSTEAVERLIYGGTFWAQLSTGLDSLTCPPESQWFVEALGSACVHSREVMLTEYPDVIVVETPPARFAKSAYVGREHELENACSEFNNTIRRKIIRVNFEKDVFFMRSVVTTGCHQSVDDETTATRVYKWHKSENGTTL